MDITTRRPALPVDTYRSWGYAGAARPAGTPLRAASVCAHPAATTRAPLVRAARTASTIGLQANQCGKARMTAGIPSKRTRRARTASPSVVRPSHTR
jgi:hypothetical protein